MSISDTLLRQRVYMLYTNIVTMTINRHATAQPNRVNIYIEHKGYEGLQRTDRRWPKALVAVSSSTNINIYISTCDRDVFAVCVVTVNCKHDAQIRSSQGVASQKKTRRSMLERVFAFLFACLLAQSINDTNAIMQPNSLVKITPTTLA